VESEQSRALTLPIRRHDVDRNHVSQHFEQFKRRNNYVRAIKPTPLIARKAHFTLTPQDKSDQLFVSVPGRWWHDGAGEQTGERRRLHPLLIE
jgi:hypothetical protein